MKVSTVIFVALLLLTTRCQNDHNCDPVNRCELEPDAGPCEALIVRYYFDQTEQRCKPFNWGGCDGVVPFQTLEECQNGCGSQND